MSVVAVVLAAGQGARLGGVAKALLGAAGPGEPTFLARIAATCAAAGVGALVVVVGAPFAREVGVEAARLGARVVVNPDPARGMASSIACGFGALDDGDRALLWPVDHPHARADTVAALLAVDADIVVPRHGGRGGHPVAVARAVWPALAACPPQGARVVLRDRRWARREIDVDDPGVIHDIDLPADLLHPGGGCAGS